MALPISVIIPTLDEERTIMDTLKHTASLGFDELIVVDGGSADEPPALVDHADSGISAQSYTLGDCSLWTRQTDERRPDVERFLLFLHADIPLMKDIDLSGRLKRVGIPWASPQLRRPPFVAGSEMGRYRRSS